MISKNHEVYKHKHICLVEDHYNPLGIVRSLGEEGIKPIVTIDLLKTRLSEAEDVKNELSPIIEKYLKQGLTFEEITRMFVEIMRENRIKI